MNSLFLLIFFGFILVSLYYYFNVFNKIKKYTNINTDISGMELIRKISDNNKVDNLYIVKGRGINSNYYNQTRNVVYLNDSLFDNEDLLNNVKAIMLGGLTVLSSKKLTFVNVWNQLFLILRYFILTGYFLVILGFFGKVNDILYLGILMVIVVIIINVIFLKVQKEVSRMVISFLEKDDLIKEDYVEDAKEIVNSLQYQYLAMPITVFLSLFNK